MEYRCIIVIIDGLVDKAILLKDKDTKRVNAMAEKRYREECKITKSVTEEDIIESLSDGHYNDIESGRSVQMVDVSLGEQC